MPRTWVVFLVVAMAAAAHAAPRIKRLEIVELEPRPEEPFASRVALRAVVSGAVPGLRPQDFALRIDDGATPVLIGATRSVPFGVSDEELALMVLVQGTVRFMGNDAPAPGEEAREGYHDVVKQAIDAIARARPRRTRAALYVYGNTAEAKVPMGPIESLSGEALGPQEAYAGVTTKALQRGLEEALRVLGSEPGRRVLFVIGDGGDQRESYAIRDDLARLAAASIEVYALGITPQASAPVDRLRVEQMGRLGAHRFANQKEQVPQLAEVLMNEIDSVYTVEFPEVQASDRQMIPTDGLEHELVIKVGLEETEAVARQLPGPFACLPGMEVRCLCDGKAGVVGPPCAEPPPAMPGWAWVAMAGGLALAGAGTVMVARRRRDDGDADVDEDEGPLAAVPEPILAPPPPPPPPPAWQTVAIGALDDEQPPVVAWIVPIDGPSAYTTFRLRDRTVIGAGPECDVRIADPHMSKQHAEIALVDGSYVLTDRGSRNGVRFLDRKVTRHVLVDNDQFSLGGTAFKFKWTE